MALDTKLPEAEDTENLGRSFKSRLTSPNFKTLFPSRALQILTNFWTYGGVLPKSD